MGTTTEQPSTETNNFSKDNRIAILKMMERHWQQKFNEIDASQFDYLCDISYEIADMLPSDVHLDKEQMSWQDILENARETDSCHTAVSHEEFNPDSVKYTPDNRSDQQYNRLYTDRELMVISGSILCAILGMAAFFGLI